MGSRHPHRRPGDAHPGTGRRALSVEAGDAIPDSVYQAQSLADAHGFALSCEPGVGALLSVLAAALPAGGRILELGTGAGVGLAWLFHGLGDRSDAEVVSVDIDADVQALARQASWSDRVQFRLGDGCELLPRLGSFDIVFADAPGGKLAGLDRSIAALTPGGVLIVDDMDLSLHDDRSLRAGLQKVRSELLGAPELHTVELDLRSGVMLSVRRRAKLKAGAAPPRAADATPRGEAGP